MARYILGIDNTTVRVNLAETFVCGGVYDNFVFTAEVETSTLDESGFTVDVKELIAAVHKAFDPADGMLVASCEQLAEGVANVFYRVMGSRLERCEVIVYNLTGRVEFSWTDEDPMPRFPSLATKDQKAVAKKSRSSC